MNKHLNATDWNRLLGNGEDMEDLERVRMLMHIAECSDCKQLYDAGITYKAALRAAAAAAEEEEDQGYAAVAGADDTAGGRVGLIMILIERTEGGPRFRSDTLEASGEAMKYVLSLTGDSRVLSDDDGLLRAELGEDEVLFLFGDTGKACAKLGRERTEIKGRTALPLPPGPECRLELFIIG